MSFRFVVDNLITPKMENLSMNNRPHLFLERSSIVLSIVAILLLAISSHAQISRSVSWNTDKVSQTFGNGATAASTDVTFTVSSVVTDASIFVVPEVAQYVAVETVLPATLQPGTEYTIRLDYSLPPNAIEGTYLGTVHLRSGSRAIPAPLPVTI